MQPILFFEDIDTTNIAGFTDEQILVKDSWRLWKPTARHKIYRNNKPLAKQQSSKWIETNKFGVPNPVAAINPDVPQAAMGVRFSYPA